MYTFHLFFIFKNVHNKMLMEKGTKAPSFMYYLVGFTAVLTLSTDQTVITFDRLHFML